MDRAGSTRRPIRLNPAADGHGWKAPRGCIDLYAIFIPKCPIPTASICAETYSARCPNDGSDAMDLVYLALIAALTLGTAAFLWLCDRIGDRK